MPVRVRVETAARSLLDEMVVVLHPDRRGRGGYLAGRRVILSSRLETPDRARPVAERRGRLQVRPGCTLVLVLSGLAFRYPLPFSPLRKIEDLKPLPEPRTSGDLDGRRKR